MYQSVCTTFSDLDYMKNFHRFSVLNHNVRQLYTHGIDIILLVPGLETGAHCPIYAIVKERLIRVMLSLAT